MFNSNIHRITVYILHLKKKYNWKKLTISKKIGWKKLTIFEKLSWKKLTISKKICWKKSIQKNVKICLMEEVENTPKIREIDAVIFFYV